MGFALRLVFPTVLLPRYGGSQHERARSRNLCSTLLSNACDARARARTRRRTGGSGCGGPGLGWEDPAVRTASESVYRGFHL